MPEGRIERSLSAKEPATEALRCHNWLHRPQRFRVLVEKQSGDASTSLSAAQYVDVPALSHKDVSVAVVSYTASTTTAKVTFRNEESG